MTHEECLLERAERETRDQEFLIAGAVIHSPCGQVRHVKTLIDAVQFWRTHECDDCLAHREEGS